MLSFSFERQGSNSAPAKNNMLMVPLALEARTTRASQDNASLHHGSSDLNLSSSSAMSWNHLNRRVWKANTIARVLAHDQT